MSDIRNILAAYAGYTRGEDLPELPELNFDSKDRVKINLPYTPNTLLYTDGNDIIAVNILDSTEKRYLL